MKNRIIYFMTTVMVLLTACQDEDNVKPTTEGQGITRLIVKFVSGELADKELANYVIADPQADTYVIPVPWFYPEASFDETTEYMSAVKVEANLPNNFTLSPTLGILDLTKDNHFTLTNPYGVKKDIIIKGERTKSSACDILAFGITSPEITGIINQDAKTISIISIDDLTSCLAEYSLSPHATISPDPATIPMNLSAPVQLTVTAHNGVDMKTYTIKKEIPAKIGYGYRTGSEISRYAVDLSTLGFPAVTAPSAPTLAVAGNHLVLNYGNGSTPIYLNRATGVKIGNITLGSANASGSVVSDTNGNMLIMNRANSGQTLNVYKTKSATTAPTLLFSYPNTTGFPIGSKVSVQGNLDADAIIVATCEGIAGVTGSSSFVRWTVSGGVVGTPTVAASTGVSTWTSIDNAPKISYRTTTLTDGYFLGHYDGGNDNFFYLNGTSNAATSSLSAQSDGSAWGMGNNLADAKTFNNARYMLMYSIGYFPHWGLSSRFYLYDVTNTSSFGGTAVDKSSALTYSAKLPSFDGGAAKGDERTGDILLYPSADGYTLNIYYIDNMNRVVGCYEFDCIDK